MVTMEERIAINDVITRYIYAMDTSDIDGAIASFVPGAECKDVTGRTWNKESGGVGGFARHFLKNPGMRGGQHYFQTMKIEKLDSSTLRVRSFFSFGIWNKSVSETPSLRLLGLYTHTINSKSWLIQHMVIEPWIEGDPAN